MLLAAVSLQRLTREIFGGNDTEEPPAAGRKFANAAQGVGFHRAAAPRRRGSWATSSYIGALPACAARWLPTHLVICPTAAKDEQALWAADALDEHRPRVHHAINRLTAGGQHVFSWQPREVHHLLTRTRFP
jgi:hypothetical protein